MLSLPGNERALVAALLKEPKRVYEISPVLKAEAFQTDSHRAIYEVIVQSVMEDSLTSIDKLTLFAQAEKMGIHNFSRLVSDGQYIDALVATPVNASAIPAIVNNIQKAHSLSKLRDHYRSVATKLESGKINTEGEAKEVVSIIQSETMDVVHELFKCGGVETLGDGLDKFLASTAESGLSTNFVSTGHLKLDAAMGGGLRKAGLTVVAGRPKSGKTTLTDDILGHCAIDCGVPVLYLDTEMNIDFHRTMMLARTSEIPRSDIESGLWRNSEFSTAKVNAASEKVSKSPFHYKSVAGVSIEESAILIREFIHKYVGLDEKGFAKDCVIAYDFLQLDNIKKLAPHIREHQLLGHYLTLFRTLSVKYRVPIVLGVQLNREGIEGDYGTASGTDRIEWYCSSMIVVRKKGSEEINTDTLEQGNVKARVNYARYGPAHDEDDYLNLIMRNAIGKIQEGKTRKELWKERQVTQTDAQSGSKDSTEEKGKRGRRKAHKEDTATA